MKGSYLKPIKQEVYDNWVLFMHKACIPHTQVCDKCNMVLEVEYLSEIRTPYGPAGAVPGTKKLDTRFMIKCLGCGGLTEFTGASHLSRDIQDELWSKLYKSEHRWKRGFWEEMAYDNPEFFDKLGKAVPYVVMSFVLFLIIMIIL